jgi:phytoene desaturase (3,4-didehydrolycopene-forming)
MRVLIVGGGVGGLTAAGLIKRRQPHATVTLLEKNEVVGGRCHTEHINTPCGKFRFDTGPSLLLFPGTYRETFEALGETMEDHVSIRRVNPAYRAFFHAREASDGVQSVPSSSLDLSYDVQEMMQQLERVEKGAGSNYVSWLASSRLALDLGVEAFIKQDFHSPWDFLTSLFKLVPVLPRINLLDLLLPLHQRLKARGFKDPRLLALLSFQVLYVGLTPFNAPGAFSLLTATELTDAVWYPLGGFERVKDSMREIADKLGVEVRTGASVESIKRESVKGPEGSTQVKGVVLKGGEEISADVVVSNIDLPLSCQLLNDPSSSSDHPNSSLMSRGDFSAGVIAFYLCIDTSLPLLQHHNVFLSTSPNAWRRATTPSNLSSQPPNFYLCCPNRTDPDAAPSGCESVMILLPVANAQEMKRAGQAPSYEDLVESGRSAVLKALCASGVFEGSLESLQAHIVHERVIDPSEWGERYGLAHGAAFGLSHGLNQLSILRPSQRDPDVDGLFYVGASTRPGNGVPLCMISGKLVAEKVDFFLNDSSCFTK